MKKKIIIFLSIVLAAIVISCSAVAIHINITKQKNEEVLKNTTYYKECELIKKYNTNIMIYGEERRTFNYLNKTNISNFEELKLTSEYNVLIVNDLYSETVMSDSNYLTIKNTVLENENKLMFIYYGNKKNDKLVEYGIETTLPREDTLGIVYGPSKYHSSIFYTTADFETEKEYPKLFEESLASLIVKDYLEEVIG